MEWRQQFINLCDEIIERLDEFDTEGWSGNWWDDVWRLTHDLEDAKDHLPFSKSEPALLIFEFRPNKKPCRHVKQWCEYQWEHAMAGSLEPYAAMRFSDPITGTGTFAQIGWMLPQLTPMTTPNGRTFSSRWESPLIMLDKAQRIARRWYRAAERLPPDAGNDSTRNPRGPKPDPKKDEIERLHRSGTRKVADIVDALDLKKWNGRPPHMRVERVVNAMQQRARKKNRKKPNT